MPSKILDAFPPFQNRLVKATMRKARAISTEDFVVRYTSRHGRGRESPKLPVVLF